MDEMREERKIKRFMEDEFFQVIEEAQGEQLHGRDSHNIDLLAVVGIPDVDSQMSTPGYSVAKKKLLGGYQRS